MSAFDYPRLMLTGTAVCSPATGNNGKFVPLAIFDPVTGNCAIPPRLFISGAKSKEFCASKDMVVNEVTIDTRKYVYVEIAPDVLNDPKNFKEWALLPLGKYDGDEAYHELYKMFGCHGKRPGYFNYYGTTEFDFKEVKVGSIALNATAEGEKIIKEKDGSVEYKALADLFKLELKINEGLTSKAKLIDAASSVSLATQIFWDKLTLTNSSEVVFGGKPYKASLRFSNASRLPDLQGTGGAHCGSGTFFSAIKIEDIENGHKAELLKQLFEKYKTRKEELIGLQIAFNLFEVKENIDLQIEKPSPNNVETKVVVAITPWYKGDLKSMSMGRQLNAGVNYLKKCLKGGDERIKDFFLSPVVAQVDYERQYLMLDLINNIPEKYDPDPSKPKEPPYPIPGRDNDRFQTMDIGVLVCKLYKSGKELGRISLTKTTFSRQYYLDTAGKIVLHNNGRIESIEYRDTLMNDSIALYLYDSTGEHNLIGDTKEDYVMLESEFMLASDNGSLYGSQNDDPAHGYRSFSGQKEPCHVTIYQRGFEYPRPIPVTIMQCEVKPWNLKYVLSPYRVTHYKSNDVVSFPTEKAFNGLYLLYANIDSPKVDQLMKDVYNGPFAKWLWYYLMNYFNSYVAVRILPHQDYAEYLDIHKKKRRKQVTFEVLKKEIFDNYDFLYPVMSRIFPFEESAMKSYQDYIYNLMSSENWESSSHMPVSRDLSPQQFRLFLEWMNDNDSTREGGAYHHSADMEEPIESILNEHGIIPR